MYYLFIMRRFVYIGNWFVYIGKNHRFTAFLDSKIHTRLAIVTANELGLAFPPRNLPKKFRPDPSTFYLVIVVTERQTDRQPDRQTYANDYIILAFAGIIMQHQYVRLADSLVCGSQSTGIVDFLRIVTETYLILHQYAV